MLTIWDAYYTITLVVGTTYVRLAQLDRAFGYGPKGREFESSNARDRQSIYRLPFFFAILRNLFYNM